MLGHKVTAITPSLQEIEGIVVSIHLGEDGRKMVRLKYTKADDVVDGVLQEGGEAMANVDYAAVNPTAKFIELYKKMHKDVGDVSREGNEKIQVLVKEYNAKVDALTNEVLGEKVAIIDV